MQKQPEGEFLYHSSCDECGSSDANAVYTTNTYCYSCETWKPIEQDEEVTVTESFNKIEDIPVSISAMPINGFRERKITKAVAEYYDVKSEKLDDDIISHYYPYTKDGKIVGYKERQCADKQFRTYGDMKGVELFGQGKFKAGGRKLIITEGELDAMAVAQAHQDQHGHIYPAVSVPGGAQSAKKAILANIDWVKSFNEVIIMFDQDEVGQQAVNDVARVIGAEKAKVAKLKHKDACDSYLAEGQHEILNQVWNAQPWCPAGIVNSKDTWDQYVTDREAVYVPYPPFVEGLNRRIFGRRFGSITMFTSGTGSGKTSFLREDMYHLMKTTDAQIGICSLEESVAETTRGFISLELNKRVGIPGTETTEEEERQAWEQVMGSGRFEILDHQGSIGDTKLLDKLEYLACTCDFVYLDHITIAVSEAEGDINKAIDSFMSELLKMAKRHNVWFGIVSHLRKTGTNQDSFEEGGDISEDDLKGSGSLKQISAQTIALTRNKHAEDPNERHTVKVKVLKDRFGGDTGWADSYRFNMETGRLMPGNTNDHGFVPLDEINTGD